MLKVGFDLDGTLDRDALRSLAIGLLDAGAEVHIITGVFPDGEWQNESAKLMKLDRLGIPAAVNIFWKPGYAMLHTIIPEDGTKPIEWQLREIGLRKGDLCEKLGLDMYFDDNATYCELIRAFSGDTTVLQVK